MRIDASNTYGSLEILDKYNWTFITQGRATVYKKIIICKLRRKTNDNKRK